LKKENTELKARLSKFENLKWFLVLKYGYRLKLLYAVNLYTIFGVL